MAPNHKERGWTFEKNLDSHCFNRREREDLIQKQRFVFGWENKIALT